MDYQPIFDIAALCAGRDVRQVVMCPGSRCAPLTLAFTRHPEVTTRTFSDERSAGFVGLGLAQQLQQPVVLLCTSGTAAYNFAPAVAEAYFSQTPLIIFTADRPAAWIAQHDGQTIFQADIFGKHVKKSFQLPEDHENPDSKWAINRMVNEAINLSAQEPKGPVHINAPFREPLYPAKGEQTTFSPDIRLIREHLPSHSPGKDQMEFVRREWNSFKKILIVAGQQDHNAYLTRILAQLSVSHGIPVAGDIVSNIHGTEEMILHADLFLGQAPDPVKKTLQPDLLITFGKSLVSKNLKLFLRKYHPSAHWHIQPAGIAADPFKNVTNIFYTAPVDFFEFIASLPGVNEFDSQKQLNFKNLWQVEERRAKRVLTDFFPSGQISEMEVVKAVIENLPENTNLHLANSMSVRYANFIGLHAAQKNIRVFANRGTSGIDGCSSTAVGHALGSNELHVLITGDVAFFYDRNAFWHNYNIENVRIVLLNNHGGLIFNMIDGPASQPEAPEYFVTRQKLNATKLCEEFDMEHLRLDNTRKVKNLVKAFFERDGKPKILETETGLDMNRTVFDNLKQTIKNSYAT